MEFADIEAQLASDKQLKRCDITQLEEWQRRSRHLPSPLHSIETALFLHRSRYNIEVAKRRIDAYYSIRTQYPEIFAQRHLFGQQLQLAMDTWIVTTLPELTADGDMVVYCRMLDHNPNVYDFNATLKLFDMVVELALKAHGCCKGHIILFDMEGASLAHLVKVNVQNLRIYLHYLQIAMPMRLTSFHFVNGVSFMNKILSLMRPLLKNENKLYVHWGDNATVFKYLNEHIVPTECGGSTFCATEFYKNVTRKHLESQGAYFECESRQRVDESQRPARLTNDWDLFGADGTFTKFDID